MYLIIQPGPRLFHVSVETVEKPLLIKIGGTNRLKDNKFEKEMGQPVDIFRLSGRKYPIYILPITFSTVSLASVALRYAEHVISERIFPGRFLGEMVTIPMKPPSIVVA